MAKKRTLGIITLSRIGESVEDIIQHCQLVFPSELIGLSKSDACKTAILDVAKPFKDGFAGMKYVDRSFLPSVTRKAKKKCAVRFKNKGLVKACLNGAKHIRMRLEAEFAPEMRPD